MKAQSIVLKKRAEGLLGIIVVALIALLFISSCTVFNGTRLEGLLGGEENMIDLAYSIADDLEKHAFPPLIPRHPDQPVITTTFVNNENFDETSTFSRILQEHISSRFVQHGYTVREIKLRQKIHIEQQSGETMLSRNINEIRKDHKAQAITLGTVSINKRNLYVAARLVDPKSGNILSTADYKIIMDKNILAMFGLELIPEDDLDLVEEPKPSLTTRLLY